MEIREILELKEGMWNQRRDPKKEEHIITTVPRKSLNKRTISPC